MRVHPGLAWSLGLTTSDIIYYETSDISWHKIANCIIDYRPVILVTSNPQHAIVIGGVKTDIYANYCQYLNPTYSTYWTWNIYDNSNMNWIYSVDPSDVNNIVSRADETSISVESDSDGIVDFDEQYRFSTFATKQDIINYYQVQ